MKLKLLEYNIQNGFCTEKAPFKFQKNRLLKASKIIQKENPDILILCEGFYWPFAKKVSMKNIKKTFDKMYNIYAPQDYQFRWAPVILSKFPIIEYENLSKHFLNYIRAKIKIKKKELILDVFHPHPSIEDKQKKEFIKGIKKTNKKYYILSGDFNSLSDKDKYDRKELLKGFKKVSSKPEVVVKNFMQKGLIPYIRKIRLNDTFQKSKNNYTIPTDFLSKDKSTAIRIDYIFCSKNFKIHKGGVIKNNLTERASDHYPIYAHLEI